MLRTKPPPSFPLGARFEKIGLWGSVWTVEEIFHRAGLPPHVRLIHAATGRHMTVAESALRDPIAFRPCESSSPGKKS